MFCLNLSFQEPTDLAAHASINIDTHRWHSSGEE